MRFVPFMKTLVIGTAFAGSTLHGECNEETAVANARRVTDVIAEVSAANFSYQEPVTSDESSYFLTVVYDTGLSVPVWSVQVFKSGCTIGNIAYSNREG